MIFRHFYYFAIFPATHANEHYLFPLLKRENAIHLLRHMLILSEHTSVLGWTHAVKCANKDVLAVDLVFKSKSDIR